jgi:hypothetical protein
MMVMGPHVPEIHLRSLEPYTETALREHLRRKGLATAERYKEFYDLGFAILVFLVHILAIMR